MQSEIAALLGFSPRNGTRTVERYRARPHVKAQAARLGEHAFVELAAAVACRQALLAVDAKGNPDHAIRLRAAATYASLPRQSPTGAQPGASALTVQFVEYVDADHGPVLLCDDGSWIHAPHPHKERGGSTRATTSGRPSRPPPS